MADKLNMVRLVSMGGATHLSALVTGATHILSSSLSLTHTLGHLDTWTHDGHPLYLLTLLSHCANHLSVCVLVTYRSKCG